MATKHGMCYTRTYLSWQHMKQRCDPNSKDPKVLKDYVLRGITVHPDFQKSFLAFYEEVGPCPGDGYSIDRIQNDKGYIYGNLRWTDAKTQQRNRSDFNKWVEYKGEKMLLCQLAELVGIDQKLLRMRLFVYGWPMERAIQNKDFRKEAA
jgi:hypothetical protein